MKYQKLIGFIKRYLPSIAFTTFYVLMSTTVAAGSDSSDDLCKTHTGTAAQCQTCCEAENKCCSFPSEREYSGPYACGTMENGACDAMPSAQ